MNVRTTVTGMALVILGIFIPIIGWFLMIPVGLIITIAGLIIKEKEEVATVKPLRPEEVLLDTDLVVSEIEAISRKIPELSKSSKTSVESSIQYVTCLKDAESKITLGKNLESSLTHIVEELKQRLQATESSLNNLERSKEAYGVQAESLEIKTAQEKAKLDELRANTEKYENMLGKLKEKRETLADLLIKELGSDTTETIELYLKLLMKYRERYGEAAEEKLEKDLKRAQAFDTHESALEELYRRTFRK